MRLRLLACAAALAFLSTPAHAGFLGGKKKLPSPIRYTTDRVERSPHVGGIIKHPPRKYSGQSWGSRFDLMLHGYPTKPLMPFLLHQDR